jgi:hypothetical protein
MKTIPCKCIFNIKIIFLLAGVLIVASMVASFIHCSNKKKKQKSIG